MTMIEQERAIGNYTEKTDKSSNEISHVERLHLVLLIEQLNAVKKYKPETGHLAVSLVDRYLVQWVKGKAGLSCLITLGLTCLLVAAKIEQSLQPSFNRLIKLLQQKHDISRPKQDLINMEEQIIRVLDFELRSVGSVTFLERYFRIFGIDQNNKDANAGVIMELANDYCSFT